MPILLLMLFIGGTLTLGVTAASAGSVSSPGASEDDFEAELASSGRHLMLATIGLDMNDQFRSQVLAYKAHKWVQLGRRFKTTNGYSPHLVIRASAGRKRAEPCYSDQTPKELNRLRCFVNGSWRPVAMPKAYRDMTLDSLQAKGRRVTAVFSEWRTRTKGKTFTATRVAKLKGRRLVASAPPLNIPGTFWPSLVERTTNTTPSSPQIAIRDSESGDRWFETLDAAGWSRSTPLTGIVLGSWGSTFVRAGAAVFSAVNQDFGYIDSDQSGSGSTSVFRQEDSEWSQVNEAPVSKGTGYPQGGVFPVGKRVWTVWEEHNGKGIAQGGGLLTKVFAARIGKDGDSFDQELKLWSGRTYFPGPFQAIEYRGGPVFLYMRQFKPNGGLHATVDMSHIRLK